MNGRVQTRASRLRLWRNRRFVVLWTSQALSEVGSGVFMVVLPLVAVVTLNSSTFQVGLLQTAATIAYLLVALPAGAVIDRRRKRPIMIACDLSRLLILAYIPFVAWSGRLDIWQLCLAALLVGICGVFFDVAYQSYLPILVKSDQLLEANGKLAATQSAAMVAGPGLGGAAISVVGTTSAVLLGSASYLLSSLGVASIGNVEPQPVSTRRKERSMRRDVLQGLNFVVRDAVLRRILVSSGSINLFVHVIVAVEVVYLVRILRVPAGLVAVAFACSAIGGIVGGFSARSIANLIGTARTLWASILGLSWTLFLLPMAQPGWGVALYSLGILGLSATCAVFNSAQIAYRQYVCPPDLLGRATASTRWITWGVMPVGTALGGVLGDLIGIRATLVVAAVGVWSSGFWMLFSPLRPIRDFERQKLPRPDKELAVLG
jgi:MFS family permease